MKKSIKKAYVFAAVLSIVLYSIGVFTGIFIQKSTETAIIKRIESLERSIENTQLEYFYINSLGDKLSCDSFSLLVDETTKNVWNIGQELVDIEKQEENRERIIDLKKEYSLLSIRAWILNNYLKEKCDVDNIIILYFYSIPCSDCIKQGFVLDDLRESVFKDKMKVFVLDIDVDEPMIQVLKKSYNVTETPSIVIGDNVYSGLVEKDKLTSLLQKSIKT